jgi:beta-mannosidase
MRKAIVLGLACCAAIGLAVGVGTRAAQAQAKLQENAAIALDHGWEFRQVVQGSQENESGWLPATVPGDVHLDLLANKKIPDPFFRDNEAKLQWIENESWDYRLNFAVTADMFARSNVDLVFDGLDTASQVYVNGDQVLNADNMFRVWRVPVKGHLHEGSNMLRVVFPSPIKAAEAAASSDSFRLKSKTQDKTYIRKAAYEYGWDWGPKFVTSGIWKPVRLEAWDKVRIADFTVRQRDVTKDVAHLSAEVEVVAANTGSAKVSILYDDDGKPVNAAEAVSLHAGLNVISFPLEIRHPKLWYPAGYGKQPIYQFTAQVSSGGPIAEERKVEAGLRSIVLHRELDKWGR